MTPPNSPSDTPPPKTNLINFPHTPTTPIPTPKLDELTAKEIKTIAHLIDLLSNSKASAEGLDFGLAIALLKEFKGQLESFMECINRNPRP